MQRWIASICIGLIVLVGCTSTKPSPTTLPTNATTPRPDYTPGDNPIFKTATAIIPTPTPEVIDNPEFGFVWYTVERTVNVRAGFSTEADILGQVRPGNQVLVYDVAQNAEGIRWGWVLDDCLGVMPAAGWVAIETTGIVWLEPGGFCER